MTPELAHAIVVKWMDNSDPDRESLLSQAIELVLAEVERLTYLLGSHADGHRCTCTMTDPGIRHGDNAHPPEWQHDPWCLTHPDMDVILAEVDRLTGLLDSVRTWATEHYDPLAHEGADTSELIEILDGAELIETPEQSAALVDTVPDHLNGDLK